MRDVWTAMAGGDVVFGHWLMSGSPTIVEVLASTGADLVAIDCEHGPLSPHGAELEACIRAAYAAGVAPVVRVPSHEAAAIGKAADMGAVGVIVPHVTTAHELTALLAAGRFPPAGTRGCHPLVRAARYGAEPWEDFQRRSEASFAVVPLFEDPEAFERLDELLDVDGLRAVAIGPVDLAARLGADAADAAAEVERLLGTLLAACAGRGISVVDGAWDAASVRRKVDAGCRGILYSADVALLAGAVRAQLGDVRDALRAPRST